MQLIFTLKLAFFPLSNHFQFIFKVMVRVKVSDLIQFSVNFDINLGYPIWSVLKSPELNKYWKQFMACIHIDLFVDIFRTLNQNFLSMNMILIPRKCLIWYNLYQNLYTYKFTYILTNSLIKRVFIASQ